MPCGYARAGRRRLALTLPLPLTLPSTRLRVRMRAQIALASRAITANGAVIDARHGRSPPFTPRARLTRSSHPATNGMHLPTFTREPGACDHTYPQGAGQSDGERENGSCAGVRCAGVGKKRGVPCGWGRWGCRWFGRLGLARVFRSSFRLIRFRSTRAVRCHVAGATPTPGYPVPPAALPWVGACLPASRANPLRYWQWPITSGAVASVMRRLEVAQCPRPPV